MKRTKLIIDRSVSNLADDYKKTRRDIKADWCRYLAGAAVDDRACGIELAAVIARVAYVHRCDFDKATYLVTRALAGDFFDIYGEG